MSETVNLDDSMPIIKVENVERDSSEEPEQFETAQALLNPSIFGPSVSCNTAPQEDDHSLSQQWDSEGSLTDLGIQNTFNKEMCDATIPSIESLMPIVAEALTGTEAKRSANFFNSSTRRGRPRKYPLPDPNVPKRPRGRPRTLDGHPLDGASTPASDKRDARSILTNSKLLHDFNLQKPIGNKNLICKKPRGRPRIRPLPDPSIPKRSRGRPRMSEGYVNPNKESSILAILNSTEPKLDQPSWLQQAAQPDPTEQLLKFLNRVVNQPSESSSRSCSSTPLEGGLNSNLIEKTKSIGNTNDDEHPDNTEFYPSIQGLEPTSPTYRNLWNLHRLGEREIIFPTSSLELVLNENSLMALPQNGHQIKDILVFPSPESNCTCSFELAESECRQYLGLRLRSQKTCSWKVSMAKLDGVRFLWPFKSS
ncbi:unnamed protein product [Bursaphelenchus okinawaensis]|uniref:Uncharacterized protein n=1 Tax=Bursaphelenchus okinawaensis TaxID=465554 RepID=A0A811KCU6_9BILA|nr:unnamed protein product [Bursaphelenchus okinawaensis]CAG9099563.1 unnamed protein product [Bursaphelenchus okinawaensis]